MPLWVLRGGGMKGLIWSWGQLDPLPAPAALLSPSVPVVLGPVPVAEEGEGHLNSLSWP